MSRFWLPALLVVALLSGAARAEVTLGLLANKGEGDVAADWQPIADDLAKTLGQPVKVVAVKDDAELARRFAAKEIQIARTNTGTALTLVEQGNGDIVARLALTGGVAEYRSLLLVRNDGPASLAALLRDKQRWTIAMGAPTSTAGYLIPAYHAFAKQNVLPESFFRSITTGNAEDGFRALAEQRVDVAVCNSDDLDKLRETYPRDFRNMRVLWQSPSFSYDPLVLNKALPAATRQKITRFFLGYGRSGAHSAQEKTRLYYADQLSGFLPSSNRQLREVTDLQLYFGLFKLNLAKQSDAERSASEKQLYRRYNQLVAVLGGPK
ncbi:phosphate/phosphite/phosphonate ABC transporter substrate-binding protein [Jeongeupia naejangsanensis]|uniref:Phosphate/phosphite/phosphonate ABC transporter substrate-binding protein n=1 Tax=Jeongeupia naejangsanensis TaxID=613195 RepID=A0ABS2BMA2_9NEIS|nr:phosphate/phosphite/phosphonate ABC transporter substrate-binding protein [Jeongeupia naejangsanensis]MBM3116745.1 phosphate/phosphite/phosphonate ABC transporter substrate-binding protein [Jeongeupia naejangsanensis]